MKPLPPTFYARPTLDVARELLGCELWVQNRKTVCIGRLVEVEAYVGETDPACHAHRGKTPRNTTMYGPPGHAYVYFTYGNHWMLNFVTEREGFPAAVLIRAVEPREGLAAMRRRRQVGRDYDLTSGPGKLTQALGITGDDNGTPLQGPRFIVMPAQRTDAAPVVTGGRIGVNAGSEYPWRFYFEGNPWVSKFRSGVRPRNGRLAAMSNA